MSKFYDRSGNSKYPIVVDRMGPQAYHPNKYADRGGSGATVGPFTIMPAKTGSAPVGYKRWRIFITASTNNNYACVGELRMRATPGGPNLATGGIPSASSFYSSGFEASKAFDGITTNTWHSGSASMPHWLEYEFPEPVDITQLSMYPRGDGEGGLAPTAFKVQRFVDNAWQDVWAVSGLAPWTTGEERIFTKPA